MPSRLATLIRKRGLLTQREAAELLAGEPIRGSWWAHPAGKRIYAALMALEDDADLAIVKLIDGKVTYVHRRLWPALIRVQREESLWPALSGPARALLAELAKGGAVRATGKPRLELEQTLSVIGRSVHTPAGHHEVELIPFARWVTPSLAKAAAALSLADALGELGAAGWQPSRGVSPGRRRAPAPRAGRRRPRPRTA